MKRAGFLEVTLWVLKENTRGLGFYRAIGFTVDPGIEKAIDLGGADLIEVRLRKPLPG